MKHLSKHLNKLPYILLLILITIATFVLFIREEKELIIISRDSIISQYHSNNNETFNVEILTNSANDYHFDTDYISSCSFISKDNNISITIKEIKTNTNPILYNDEEFYLVTFIMQLPFISNDLVIKEKDVLMQLEYMNDENISISIGEFNYLFSDEFKVDLAIGDLSATHEVVNGYNTIGGINIELVNLEDDNIIIKDVQLLSNDVSFNKEYLIEQDACNHTLSVRECLLLDHYSFSFNNNQNKELSILLRKNNTINLYMPLTYQDYPFIFRFSFTITYAINNEENTMIVDDFPYIFSSIFSDFNEDSFHVYTIPH